MATGNLKSLRKRMLTVQGKDFDRLSRNRSNGDRPRSLTSITHKSLSLPGVRIHPTLDRVLVEYDEIAGETKGGILIPSTAQVRSYGQVYPAKVLAVGPGRWREQSPAAKDIHHLAHLALGGYANSEEVDEVVARYPLRDVRLPMDYAPGDLVWAPCLNFPLYMDGREVYLCNEDALLGLRFIEERRKTPSFRAEI